MTAPSYTDRLFTQPQEHTLYPRPEHVYDCSWCAASGYHYPATGEVFAYHTCVKRSGHVWVIEGTMQEATPDGLVIQGEKGQYTAPWKHLSAVSESACSDPLGRKLPRRLPSGSRRPPSPIACRPRA